MRQKKSVLDVVKKDSRVSFSTKHTFEDMEQHILDLESHRDKIKEQESESSEGGSLDDSVLVGKGPTDRGGITIKQLKA